MTEDLGVWEGLVLSETEKLGVVALLVSCIASGLSASSSMPMF